jgi:hypothetical protein
MEKATQREQRKKGKECKDSFPQFSLRFFAQILCSLCMKKIKGDYLSYQQTLGGP